MKITLDPTGTPVVLADHGRDSVSDLEMAPERLQQIATRLRATAPGFYDRDNEHHNISFTTQDEKASYQAAEVWVLTHAAAVQGSQTLRFELTESDPAVTYDATGLLKVNSIRQIGVTVVTSYTFTCGAIALSS